MAGILARAAAVGLGAALAGASTARSAAAQRRLNAATASLAAERTALEVSAADLNDARAAHEAAVAALAAAVAAQQAAAAVESAGIAAHLEEAEQQERAAAARLAAAVAQEGAAAARVADAMAAEASAERRLARAAAAEAAVAVERSRLEEAKTAHARVVAAQQAAHIARDQDLAGRERRVADGQRALDARAARVEETATEVDARLRLAQEKEERAASAFEELERRKAAVEAAELDVCDAQELADAARRDNRAVAASLEELRSRLAAIAAEQEETDRRLQEERRLLEADGAALMAAAVANTQRSDKETSCALEAMQACVAKARLLAEASFYDGAPEPLLPPPTGHNTECQRPKMPVAEEATVSPFHQESTLVVPTKEAFKPLFKAAPQRPVKMPTMPAVQEQEEEEEEATPAAGQDNAQGSIPNETATEGSQEGPKKVTWAAIAAAPAPRGNNKVQAAVRKNATTKRKASAGGNKKAAPPQPRPKQAPVATKPAVPVLGQPIPAPASGQDAQGRCSDSAAVEKPVAANNNDGVSYKQALMKPSKAQKCIKRGLTPSSPKNPTTKGDSITAQVTAGKKKALQQTPSLRTSSSTASNVSTPSLSEGVSRCNSASSSNSGSFNGRKSWAAVVVVAAAHASAAHTAKATAVKASPAAALKAAVPPPAVQKLDGQQQRKWVEVARAAACKLAHFSKKRATAKQAMSAPKPEAEAAWQVVIKRGSKART